MSTTSPMPVAATQEERWTPYRHPQPKESPPELIVPNVIPTDERVWVPVDDNVWFRPLLFCVSRGYWMNLLKVRRAGVLSRHRHPLPVHGYVLKGKWRYLEHDWVATEGAYVYEAPGETHTLVVDPDGKCLGYDDVFTRIDKCRAHYADNGLGAEYVDQFIR